MRIQLYSDLHRERYARNRSLQNPMDDLPALESDIIVLAGDIDEGTEGMRWAAAQAEKLQKPVLYVPGNHEYYQHEYHALNGELVAFNKHSAVTCLVSDQFIYQGVRFLGATFWTDFSAYNPELRQIVMKTLRDRVDDYEVIQYGDRILRPHDTLDIHRKERDWLGQQLIQTGDFDKTVVITHTGPSRKCQNPSYPVGMASSIFYSRLDHMVPMADLWLYGHTHANKDLDIGGTRLISNQHGYAGKQVCEGFEPNLVIEL